jgi:hypothetical protein
VDLEIEKKIITSFFYKNKRDRVLFELSRNNGKEVIHKLCHDYLNYLDNGRMLLQSSKRRMPPEIQSILKENGVKSLCYVWSEHSQYHRKHIDLAEAIEAHMYNGFASLVVGLPSGFAHFQGDSLGPTQPNCFLKPTERFDGIGWEV